MSITIRPAVAGDGPILIAMVRELAVHHGYEKNFVARAEDYERFLADPHALNGALIADAERRLALRIVARLPAWVTPDHCTFGGLAGACAAGVAGAIVPDLLVDEADEMARICRRHDFNLIQLVTPTTPRGRPPTPSRSRGGRETTWAPG